MKKSEELKLKHYDLLVAQANTHNQLKQIEQMLQQIQVKIQESLQEESPDSKIDVKE